MGDVYTMSEQIDESRGQAEETVTQITPPRGHGLVPDRTRMGEYRNSQDGVSTAEWTQHFIRLSRLGR
jgi:hypothetical protein